MQMFISIYMLGESEFRPLHLYIYLHPINIHIFCDACLFLHVKVLTVR